MSYTPRNYPNGLGGQIVNNNPQPDTWTRIATFTGPFQGPIFDDSFPFEYQEKLYDLLGLWASKLARNQLKRKYYNGKNRLKDLGISIPPQLLNMEVVVGWPQKAVDMLAVRSRFDGFTATSADTQALLNRISQKSRLKTRYRPTVQSQLIQSCAFSTIGVNEDGDAQIDLHSAEQASARWDEAKGRVAYGMVINWFDQGRPVDITLYTEDAVVHVWDTQAGWWDYEIEPISMGRPTMEVFAYRPTYEKPLGQSRITRAVMSITDNAVREAIRTEVSAEFFTSPQKYLLGADDDAFMNTPKWEAYIGNIFAIGRDEDGNLPTYGQLPQGSMQPHTDYMRALAARFSGETNIPISTLGVIHDQPASAEAIYAANEALVIDCEDLNDNNRDSLVSIALMALAAQTDTPVDELSDEMRDFTANFRNPAMPSVVSQTDAMTKLAAVVPGFAGTDVFWEQVGFPEDMRRKVEAEIRENATAEATTAAVTAMFGGDNGNNTI